MSRPVGLVLATSTGGVGAHLASLIPGLLADGWQLHVCGPRSTDELFGFSRLGAQFRAVEIARPGRDPAAVTALRRASSDLDLLHAHGLRAGAVAALSARRPLVVTWHNAVLAGPGPKRMVLAAGERLVARAASVTLAASPDLATRARELGGRDVRLAPVAAPLDPPHRPAAQVRAELGAGPGQPLVVSVGRLHPQKAHDVLVRAAGQWADLEPVIVIAGDGPEREKLTALIERTGAPVRLLGHRRDVTDLLAAADLVILTSRWEARSLAVQQAMSAGRAVLVTAVGGLPELVGAGAELIPAGDVDVLAGAGRLLLSDPVRRAELGARARARAATWPAVADTVAQVAAVYRELLG